jgi:hypothetical protein
MVCSAFTSRLFSCRVPVRLGQTQRQSLEPGQGLGLTGLEPVTLRLSSACSNQLSYRPGVRSQDAQAHPGSLETPGSLRRTDLAVSNVLGGQTKHPLRLKGKSEVLEVRGFEPLTYSLQSYRSTN